MILCKKKGVVEFYAYQFINEKSQIEIFVVNSTRQTDVTKHKVDTFRSNIPFNTIDRTNIMQKYLTV
jgi:hypothetical protein